MKSSGWDNKLWHDKMQELPIPGDEDSAWDDMRALLDKNMPDTGPVTGLKFPGKRLIVIIGAVIIAGLLYYTAVRVSPSFKHRSYTENKHKTTPFTVKEGNKVKTAETSLNTTRSNNLTAGKTNGIAGDHHTENTIVAAGKNLSAKSPGNHLNAGSDLKNTSPAIKSAGRRTVSGSNLPGVNTVAGRSNPSSQTALLNDHRHNSNFADHQNGRHISASQANSLNNLAGNAVNETGATNNESPQGITPTAILPGAKSAGIDLLPGLSPINMAELKNTSNALANYRSLHKTMHRLNKPYPAANQVFSLKNSKFELTLNGGYNANTHPSAFVGMNGAYYLTPKLSLGLGVQILPSKVMSGSYHNNNYKYTTVEDSAKRTTHTADNITVNSSAKFYSIDVPIIAYYHINKHLSINGGPVIVFPVYKDDLKNTLNPLSNPADTLSAYKTIVSGANSTTINSKIGVNLSGGLRLSVNRFYLDANYVQGLSPYTISSSLGSDKVYYHTFQFGIGFYIYRPKPKSATKYKR